MQSLVALCLFSMASELQDIAPDSGQRTLFDFNKGSEAWRVVNDSVMGGVSTSRMQMSEDGATFAGTLSLANNGGFASVRSRSIEAADGNYTHIRLRVCGDGRVYQLRARSVDGSDGVSYKATFNTEPGKWIDVEVAIDEMVATHRGRVLRNRPGLTWDMVDGIGILIADKREGDFSLTIDWIKAAR